MQREIQAAMMRDRMERGKPKMVVTSQRLSPRLPLADVSHDETVVFGAVVPMTFGDEGLEVIFTGVPSSICAAHNLERLNANSSGCQVV